MTETKQIRYEDLKVGDIICGSTIIKEGNSHLWTNSPFGKVISFEDGQPVMYDWDWRSDNKEVLDRVKWGDKTFTVELTDEDWNKKAFDAEDGNNFSKSGLYTEVNSALLNYSNHSMCNRYMYDSFGRSLLEMADDGYILRGIAKSVPFKCSSPEYSYGLVLEDIDTNEIIWFHCGEYQINEWKKQIKG